MGDLKKLAGQTLIYGMSSIVGRVLNFLLVPLYVRVFAPAEYGIYTELYAYFTFLNILYTYGMETTFFRFANKNDHPAKVFSTAFFSLLFSAILFSLLIFLNRNAIAASIGYKGQEVFFTWIALILAFDTLAVIPFCSLRQNQRPIKFATIRIINILINIFFNIFFLVLCPYIIKHSGSGALLSFVNWVYNPDTGIGYIFISNLIASGLTLLFLYKEFLLFNFDVDFKLLKRMLIYSSPLVIVGFAGMVNEALDRTILKHLLPYSREQNETLLGIYGANAKLPIFMSLVIQAFRFAAEPFFFIQSKKEDAKKTYSEVMKYFVIFGLGIFLVVMLYIDIFKYFVGAKGSEYHQGLGVVPILLFANLLMGIYYNLSIWYKLEDKTKMGAIISVGGALITIGFNIVFIPLIGYFASAWAKLACYGAMVVVSYFWGQKYYPVDYPLGRILYYFTIAVVIYFTSVFAGTYLLNPYYFLKIAFNTLLLIVFIWMVIARERIDLRRLLLLRQKNG